MKKILWISPIVGLLIVSFVGIIYYEVYCSKEFQTARLVCHEYANNKGFKADWTCLHGYEGWTKRGQYHLFGFLFFPDDRHDGYLILVRYTDKCPTNTFQVGTIPNTFVRDYSDNAVIDNVELVKPTDSTRQP